MRIKITPADEFFSLCVRERAHWTCEYKGTIFEEGRIKGRCQGLHCSHYKGRGNWSTRFDPMNSFAHSHGSHQLLGSDSELFRGWVINQIGQTEYDKLLIRASSSLIGRELNKANKGRGKKNALRTHFENEFERMREMRNDGVQGRIEFNGFM